MKTLSNKELHKAIEDMRQNAIPGTWDKWYSVNGVKPARVEFPLGELTNPNIAGFVWAWNMQGKINPANIEKGDRFDAQGLEGKVSIELPYSTALLVARELPENRVIVKV